MDIAQNITVEDMASIRLWLLQEGQRLEYAKRQFEKEKDEFEEAKRKFDAEKLIITASIEEQARKTEFDAKTLATEKVLFDQKLQILEEGFRSLCKEREEFESDKENYREKYKRYNYQSTNDYTDNLNVSAYKSGVFFNGVDNLLALKKRYRDLLKIFHPDNMDGDNETVQVINQEYERLKQQF